MDNEEIKGHDIKDATIDAAAILLALSRDDFEGVSVIINNGNPSTLLSGMIAVSFSNLQSLTNNNPEPFITELVNNLNKLSEKDWDFVASNTLVIDCN